MCVRRCPTFPPGVGSIIGAGRLSFRVRDGSGRFPAAMCRRNSIHLFSSARPCVFGGGVWCCLVVVCGCEVCVCYMVVQLRWLFPLGVL